MSKVFTCKECGYVFVAEDSCEKCIDCAKEIREANQREIDELNKKSKKGKVYAQVMIAENERLCWYEDVFCEYKNKDLVKVPYQNRIVLGQIVNIIHCLEEEKPIKGTIKPIYELVD